MPDIEVHSQISGSIWKVLVGIGDAVAEDDPLVIIESMKMEIPLLAPERGTVKEVRVTEGQAVAEGDVIVILER